MTEPNERSNRAPAPPAPTEAPPTEAPPTEAEARATEAEARPVEPGAELRATLQDGARAFDVRAQALGREAEAAIARLGESPAIRETADVAGRVWGLVLLAAGIWFFADVTLRLDMPAVAWRDLWPMILIIVGGIVVLRGLARRA